MLRHVGICLALVCLAMPRLAYAQIPAKCFEIESILVDACTSGGQCANNQEGQNEMVRFITGAYDIALSDIYVDWPNNNFQGLVQNANTASITAELNAQIVSCGHLLEPAGGVIPAGSRVLMISSTDVCAAANSFAALTDTLYLIFQNAANTSGHFANQNNGSIVSETPSGGPSYRTLVMTYTPNNCSDTVTYDRQLLVNIYGTYGGSPPENDGATARFTWPGAPVTSYVNNGCQAPFIPLLVDIIAVTTDLACGESLGLLGTVIGGYDQLTWSGGTGAFSDPDSAVTTYTAGAMDNGPVTLYLCVTGVCADGLCDSVVINIEGTPTAMIMADGPTVLCDSGTVTLTASGGDAYEWGQGQQTPSIVVDQSGTYTVTVSNACGSDTESITVTAAVPPQAAITGDPVICAGASTVLTASGGITYSWNTGDDTPSITVTDPGMYTVTVSDGCSTDQASVVVSISSIAVAATASPSSGSAPLAVGFEAQCEPAAASWWWDLGDGTTSSDASPFNTFTEPGVYVVTVTATNADGCTGIYVLTVLVSELVPSSVIVPNVFSPNGDGENDAFQIISTGLASLEMNIFNRWGQQLFTIARQDQVWNGLVDGDQVSEGTYFYRLVATGLDGKAYDLHGSITVVR